MLSTTLRQLIIAHLEAITYTYTDESRGVSDKTFNKYEITISIILKCLYLDPHYLYHLEFITKLSLG